MSEESADPAALYRRDNTDLTLALARDAATVGVKRFVFISTAKVWGEGRAAPYTEADPPAPQDDYARSKLAAEEGLFAIARETGMEVVVLRPPLVYGPGVRANFESLMGAVERGSLLPLGAIRNARSLVSSANLGTAIVSALTNPAAANRVFGISDGEDVSTPDLIRRLAAALGRPARVLSVPRALLLAAGAITGRGSAVSRLVGTFVLDTSAIRTELGWRPVLSLNEGLRETAKWYRSDRNTGG
jgi:nucleoside-diphosphate-sugar epimerase